MRRTQVRHSGTLPEPAVVAVAGRRIRRSLKSPQLRTEHDGRSFPGLRHASCEDITALRNAPLEYWRTPGESAPPSRARPTGHATPPGPEALINQHPDNIGSVH